MSTFIFDDKETAKIKEVNAAKLALLQAKRSAKELKNSTVNKIAFSNIVVKDKITKTAILTASIMYAAKHINKCSVQQISYFIDNELKADVLHSEKDTAKRVRNHLIADFVKKATLVKIDEYDIVHFSDVLRADAKREYTSVVALLKRVNKDFIDKSVTVKEVDDVIVDSVVAKDKTHDKAVKTITRKVKKTA